MRFCSVEKLDVHAGCGCERSEVDHAEPTARLAFVVAERVLPLYPHKFAPKTYTQPQLLACLLVKEYLRLEYRSEEEVIDASDRLRTVLGLKRAPDHSTLWHFTRHRVTPELIERALVQTVRLLDPGVASTRSDKIERTL